MFICRQFGIRLTGNRQFGMLPSAHTYIYMNINLYENKSGHYEHIYFIIKLYENKAGHYKYIHFNFKLYENKSGHYCNVGNDWSHWTLTGFPYIHTLQCVSLVNSVKVVIIIH
jgi:hypothetical protein